MIAMKIVIVMMWSRRSKISSIAALKKTGGASMATMAISTTSIADTMKTFPMMSTTQ